MISQRSRYALRALTALARAGPEQTLRIAAIAEREAIPKKFLEQILLDLKRAGLVDSRRGKKGGYLLLRRPQAISLGDVLRATEGDAVPPACLAGGNAAVCAGCRDRGLCTVRPVFLRIAAASAEILDGTTLAAVLSEPPPLPQEAVGEGRLPIILVKR